MDRRGNDSADLRAIGLSSYEDRAYRGLLDVGPASATAVAEATEVPRGRIYDVLESLEARGMVRTQTASRPKQYVAVEPEIAVNRVVEAQTRELQSEIDQYEVVGNQLVDALSSDSSVEDRFWTTAIGTGDAIELLFERIDAATETVVLVADVGTPTLDVTEIAPDALDHLASALDRGVDVSVMVSRDLVETAPPWLIDRVVDDPFDNEHFEIRTTGELYGGFYLIDHDELCFDVVNPIDGDGVVGLINLKDPEFALEMEEQFRKHWERADPFDPAG